MIFKKIGNMENVEAICHYLASPFSKRAGVLILFFFGYY